MEEVSIIGVDLAKIAFQLHGAAADGAVVFRKKLSRLQFARFMTDHPACDVAMEACPSAHRWARELSAYRTDHCARSRNLRAADGPVPAWPRFCRLARVGAAATFFWRETEAGENIEDGAAGHPTTACHRRDGGGPLGPAPWRTSKPLA